MKTHRSTQLFPYCSVGEHSLKCVRPALKIEENKEEQRGVVRFFVTEGAGTRAIKSKRPGVLSDGTANLVRDKLERFSWETLQHPPYSPDLSPSDFHIFGDLKKDIRGRQFHSDEEAQEWVRLWILQRHTSFYKTGIDCIVSQWDKCINISE